MAFRDSLETRDVYARSERLRCVFVAKELHNDEKLRSELLEAFAEVSCMILLDQESDTYFEEAFGRDDRRPLGDLLDHVSLQRRKANRSPAVLLDDNNCQPLTFESTG